MHLKLFNPFCLFAVMAVKIFFPTSCSAAENGLLIGRWMEEHRSAIILATLHFPFIPANVRGYLSQLERTSGTSLSVLGTWSHRKAEDDEKMENFLGELSSIFSHQPWLRMARESSSKFWDCRVERLGDGASEDVTLVYYDQRKVMLSELHSASEHSEIAAMFNTVAKNQLLFANDKYDEGLVRLTHWQSEGREASIIVELGKQASVPVCGVLSFCVSVIAGVCGLRYQYTALPHLWWRHLLLVHTRQHATRLRASARYLFTRHIFPNRICTEIRTL